MNFVIYYFTVFFYFLEAFVDAVYFFAQNCSKLAPINLVPIELLQIRAFAFAASYLTLPF